MRTPWALPQGRGVRIQPEGTTTTTMQRLSDTLDRFHTAQSMPCPVCHVRPYAQCIVPGTIRITRMHRQRWLQALNGHAGYANTNMMDAARHLGLMDDPPDAA